MGTARACSSTSGDGARPTELNRKIEDEKGRAPQGVGETIGHDSAHCFVDWSSWTLGDGEAQTECFPLPAVCTKWNRHGQEEQAWVEHERDGRCSGGALSSSSGLESLLPFFSLCSLPPSLSISISISSRFRSPKHPFLSVPLSHHPLLSPTSFCSALPFSMRLLLPS